MATKLTWIDSCLPERMYARALFDIIHQHGEHALQLVMDLQGGSEELFTSANTRAAVEADLWQVANTLAYLPPVVMLRLPQLDWGGWASLHGALRQRQLDATSGSTSQDLIWYGLQALLPATLVLLDMLRQREPAWFEIQY